VRKGFLGVSILIAISKKIFDYYKMKSQGIIPSWVYNCTELNNKKLWLELDPSPDIYLQGYFEGVEDTLPKIKLYPRGPVISVDPNKLQQQNHLRLKSSDESYEDMVDMPILNEPEILHNLKVRFTLKRIYTRIGPTLIILNPYEEIQLLEAKYKAALIKELRKSILHGSDTAKMSIGEFLSRFKAHIFSFAVRLNLAYY
jgi:myosin heavy subunit